MEETRPGETRSMSGRVEGEGDLLDLRWRRGGRTNRLSSSEKGLVSSVKGLLVEVVLPLSLEQLLPSLFPSSRRLQVPPPTHLRCSAILVKVVPDTSTETSWCRGVRAPPLGGGGRGEESDPPRFWGGGDGTVVCYVICYSYMFP